ncbi:7-cyano-7-deazaguanine synthase [Methylohalomonas lacus]|uniref:7-cyano-7-deazaguanine synthase n=1 Tax=Methylohalomonas lacus TaxID=398773 RepID=A0AAE3L1K5_9GAMM|nr:7-cyano-7-deazaguanine synthase QueC [Methylohalomonas lacus]MCS3904194.1 7-cyano-7-deazaguanine synthase [Methylohalomonas lacus]
MGLATDGHNRRAVVLLSGGLDSATTLAMAGAEHFDCYALSFDYGQRHGPELKAAGHVADHCNAREHRVITMDLRQFGGSALTDDALAVPAHGGDGIPITYVPARNTIFLSYALGWAEVLGANDIFIGVNAVDYSGYPDCRPEYIHAYETLANLATKRAVEGETLRLHAPLIDLSKADIIRRGVALGVDYALTVSCYQADAEGRACGNCDSCHFRVEGFRSAGIPDPTRYQ